MVAVADSPAGPFTALGPREVGTWSGYASDHNVFQDDDGKAYLVYTDHTTAAGRTGDYVIRIDSLTDDYLNSNKEGILAMPGMHEAPAMAKYKGKYIVAASGVDGWGGSETSYATASSPMGPYSPPEVMSEKKTWGSQVTSLFHIRESDTLVAMCDQWMTPDKTDLNKSRYFWIPVDVDAGKGTARMLCRDRWNPWAPQQKEIRRNGFLRPGDTVMFLGNSITAQAAPEFEFLRTSLDQSHPELARGDGAVRFIREGTPGWQAWQGLEKLGEYLAKNKPTVCVIGYGTCEVTFQNQKSYVPAMKAIVKQLRDAGVAVTIVAPPPPSPRNWKQSFPVAMFEQGLPEMGRLARQIAEQEGIPFVDTQAAFAPLVKEGREFTTDGIHLNSDGYRVMADALLECWSGGKR
jgi:lysophospholipase L1-like esterase